jgi:hypothetical protein
MGIGALIYIFKSAGGIVFATQIRNWVLSHVILAFVTNLGSTSE